MHKHTTARGSGRHAPYKYLGNLEANGNVPKSEAG